MAKSARTRVTSCNCPNCGAALEQDATTCSYCSSAVAVKICPSCFGAVSVGMKHCPTCGSDATAAQQGKETSLQCPRCETKLSMVLIGKYSLHQCVQCGGLWVDKACFQNICTQYEEQEAVLGHQVDLKPAPPKKGCKPHRYYIPCPQCGKLMNHKNFSGCSGIVLDWCRDHGSWFDKRELQQVVTFIRNGGLKKAREREKANLQDEKQRLRMQQFDLAVRASRGDTISSATIGFNRNNDSFLEVLSQLLFG
jgi:Zn-finger nucleic acid-binding protein